MRKSDNIPEIKNIKNQLIIYKYFLFILFFFLIDY